MFSDFFLVPGPWSSFHYSDWPSIHFIRSFSIVVVQSIFFFLFLLTRMSEDRRGTRSFYTLLKRRNEQVQSSLVLEWSFRCWYHCSSLPISRWHSTRYVQSNQNGWRNTCCCAKWKETSCSVSFFYCRYFFSQRIYDLPSVSPTKWIQRTWFHEMYMYRRQSGI